MLIWSYGGGTQSIAIAILVAQGKLPKPDLIVMADTDGEMTETWEYLLYHVLPLLDKHGLSFHIAPHSLATVGDYSKKGKLLIPVYTETGKMDTYCSGEWKREVVRRYLRSLDVKECTMWLGMSTDEVERLKPSRVQWVKHEWPLCFITPMNRAECTQLILNYGWPDPPKSACIWCPHRRNPQWAHMKAHYPQDFARAVEKDRLLRQQDKRGGVWVHEDRKPLDEIDFSQPDQPGLFDDCKTGYCFI